MKEFFSLVLVLLLSVLALSSCAKDNSIDPNIFDQKVEAQAAVYSVDLQFDAPAEQQTATIEFYDDYGQEVAVVTIPTVEIQKATFVSESRPSALYTPGLVNVNSDGVLPLPESNIKTKGGGNEPLLLVIR